MVWLIDVFGRKCAEVIEVEEESVAMIWRQVKLGKKICPKNSSFYVCDCKIKCERLVTNRDLPDMFTVTRYEGAICSLQLYAIRAFEALMTGRWKN